MKYYNVSFLGIIILIYVFSVSAEVSITVETDIDEDTIDISSDVKIDVEEDINGIGRFYLKTSLKSLNINNSVFAPENIQIYNSGNNILNITGLPLGESAKVTVYNALGKKVASYTIDTEIKNSFKLDKVAKGVYLVNIKTNSIMASKKLFLK